jgi:hypothetical protein
MQLCRPIKFPWSATKATLHLPSVGGEVLNDQPSMAYDGPFMRSTLGSLTVQVSSGTAGAIQEEYDFSTDEIRRLQ